MKDDIADKLNEMPKEEDGQEYDEFTKVCQDIISGAVKQAADLIVQCDPDGRLTANGAKVAAGAAVAATGAAVLRMISEYNNTLIPTLKQIDIAYSNNIGVLQGKIHTLEDKISKLESQK
jgi:hypothetical protein